MNIVSIVAKTNTGELFDIPVSDLSKYTGTLSIGDGYLPKLSAGKFVASSVMEDKNGQIFFKNYKNDKSYIGTPVALLGYDINGGITPVPLVNRSQPVNTVTTSQSFVFNGTPLTIPIFSSDGSGLEDSDFKKFGNGNYSLGGTNPFFKFDVDKGSINIAQQTTNDAFRINNKIVITVDQSNDEITIGNTIYHTANIQHIKTDSIQFNTSATGVTGGVGVLTWNDTDGTLEFGMKGGNVTQQIGQKLPVLVKHADNSGLTNGSVVYIVGSDDSNETVRLAKADSEVTSSKTFGVMTESATGGNKAFCTTFGLVRDINTSSLTEGSAVYLSPSVAGGITSTKPTAPNHTVLIGFCIRSHSTNGSIFVNINNGYELDELHDVLIGTKTNKDLLSYESVSGLWKNKTFAELGLATVDAFWSISGNNIATTGIIGSTTAQDVEFKANNQNRFTMYANAGLAIHSDTTFEDIVTLESSVNMSALTASQILALDASKNIQSLSTVTYPSLTELSYIKGLTSSAQTQINSKEPIISAGTVSQYWRGDKSWQTLDKSAVGLGNVDNTTDLLKPISTATQAALDLKANLAGPTFTGTVTLPSTTSIGSVSSTEIGYLDGVTSSIQSQINGKFDTPSGLTTNYLPKWTANGLKNSQIFDNGSRMGIGQATPLLSLEVNNISSDTYSRPSIGGRSADASRWGYLLAPINGGTIVDLIRSNNTDFRIATESVLGGGTFTNQFYINSNGSVGIGTTSLTNYNLRVSKNSTGATSTISIANDGAVLSDVTSSATGYLNTFSTQASAFTLANYTHYQANQTTIGAGSTVTNQYGFHVNSNLTGATYNMGFRGAIPSGTNRWNNYHDGTAQNYFAGNTGIGSGRSVPTTALDVNGQVSVSLGSASAPAYTFFGDLNNGWFSPTADTQAWSVGGSEVMRLSSSGSLGIGTTSLTGRSLSISKDITGAVTSYAVLNNGTIKSDVTTSVRLFQTSLNTEAATFTIPIIYHYLALQNSIGAGSSITSQIGFYVDASLVGAANNYGFRGVMSAASRSWNNYHDGTAQNWFAGNTGIGSGRSVPVTALDVNGQVSVSLGSTSAPAYTFFGDLNNGWYSPAADTQGWVLNGSEAMRLNSTGLGIGVTPVYKLDVNGTGHFTGAVTFDTVPSSLVDATTSNHLVRYSQWISTTTVKYLPTAVKTVSLSNITLSGTQTVSGVALIAGDRILVAGQTTQSENGIYVVAAGAWSRATDSDTDTELRGFIVSVSNGTYGGYKYINTNQSTITVGTTAVTYAEFSNLSEIDPVFITWRDLSRAANTVLAAPNGSAGAASFRSLVTADISNLNSYSSFSNYTNTTDLNTLLAGKSNTSHTHSFSSLTSIPTTVAGYGLTINTSDITGLSSYTGFSGYTTTTALNTLLSGYSTTSHTHTFASLTSIPTTISGYGIVLVASDIPSLDWSKITTGKPTTLSGYGITDAQSVLNGTGYVKMSGTTLSYINKEFVDTTTDQTIYGQKIFRDSFKVGNSLFNIQTGQPDTVDNDLKFDFITDATSFNYSISDIDDNIGTLFSIQGNFIGTNIRTDISTDLYIYRIVDSNLSTGTNKQILRTDSSGILNWTTIDGSYISNWATKQDALNGTGFVKANGTTITYDNSTYLSTSVAATTYQPLDADLTSISALTGDGVLRKVSNVWNLDTDMYLTTDTKIYFIATATQVGLVNPGTTLTVNGLGNLNLKSGIVTTGTYRSVTVDTYGRVTAGTNPTTVVGYGLTDVWTKTESDARYLLQSSYNPTWGQLTGSPIDNTAFNSTMLGYVNTSTTQTGIAGSKTFTSAMYANGTLTTNQLFVKNTTGGNAYPLSIVNALTYNGWSGSSLIKSGLDIYNDYKPLVFLGSHFMMLRGSLKLGGNSVGATGTVDFATERLDITGNIRYSGTLKPSNIAGTGWLYSNGTNDSWKLITPSDIFELSSFTGFDSRYYTKTEISDIIASTIPNGTSGHFLTRDSGGDLTFMNIDIDPVTLSANKIAVGSPQGILTEVTGFEFIDKRYLSITRKDYADQKITIGHGTNSQHALFDVQGGRMELNSNIGIRFNNLAGADTRMMVVNASGDISTQAIPTGGSGSNYLPYRRVPYGSAENTQTSDDSLRFYSSVLESELKLGISTPLSFRSDNTGYNNYIQSIGGYINMSSNRISLLVSASGQPNSGEIELSSYHNTLIHSGYGDVIINATEGDVIIKGGAVEWVTTTINGQTRQILCKKL